MGEELDAGKGCETIDCPICRGVELSPDFVERIKQAGSSPSSKPMTKEQFLAWLRDLD
ncbi:hypothetical protein [uncultured Novosphingobium sp.]|uniref:hypothetical protein n=1 Tax=uncultured Novosphingobium sp. TaxID=292277 RepID=UPI00259396B0|nr:hypothetical protein [uncultured Novosphingobium sp.]